MDIVPSNWYKSGNEVLGPSHREQNYIFIGYMDTVKILLFGPRKSYEVSEYWLGIKIKEKIVSEYWLGIKFKYWAYFEFSLNFK